MSLKVTVEGERAFAILDTFSPQVRTAFASKLRTIEETILTAARSSAAAHLRYVGKKSPGSYLAAFWGDVRENGPNVIGFVRNGHPLSHLMEDGANAHEILPKAADVLAFEGSAGMVFSKHVHSPGMKPFPALFPAFDAHKHEIAEAAEEAVADAVANTNK
jgi:hypothetical protein